MELDRLATDEVTDVHHAFLHKRPRSVAAVLRQPRGPVDSRSDEPALRAKPALPASPQVTYDLAGALPGLGLLGLLLVEGGQGAHGRLAGAEVAAAEPQLRDAVGELLRDQEAAF